MKVAIVVYKKKRFDPVGWLLEVEQGDTNATHATIQIGDYEWTTGATWHPLKGPLYGKVLSEDYQRKRGYYVCEFIQPLTEVEKQLLLTSCAALEGMPYGFDTLARLMARKRRGGPIIKLDDKPKLTVDHPICSEAVVFHAWTLGRPLCKKLGKLEPRVCTPENILTAAQYDNVIRVVKEV
jgi:hypothetical protein